MFTEFSFKVSEDAIADLNTRLHRAVPPRQSPGATWSRGIPTDLLKALLDSWRNDFSWRLEEERLAREAHLQYRREDVDLHLIHSQAPYPESPPLLALHGWPYTYAQLLPLADALTPVRSMAIPSLPGFAHSAPLAQPFEARRVAQVMHTMMLDLGYERYFVYGEDIGAPIADWIAASYPEAVIGMVASHPSFSAQSRAGINLTPEEQSFLESTRRSDETGYAHIQATRPDTLAASLEDSPIGLLAWLAEKIAVWSHGGRSSGLDNFKPDEVLSLVSLFWFTRSLGTSFRSYSEPTDFDDHPVIRVPAAILINTHESAYPRSLAEKSYTDVRAFTRLSTGGHFTAWENPVAVTHALEGLAAQVHE